jgi:hypothetical protein
MRLRYCPAARAAQLSTWPSAGFTRSGRGLVIDLLALLRRKREHARHIFHQLRVRMPCQCRRSGPYQRNLKPPARTRRQQLRRRPPGSNCELLTYSRSLSAFRNMARIATVSAYFLRETTHIRPNRGGSSAVRCLSQCGVQSNDRTLQPGHIAFQTLTKPRGGQAPATLAVRPHRGRIRRGTPDPSRHRPCSAMNARI